MITTRHVGVSACVLAVLLLAMSLAGGREAIGSANAATTAKAAPTPAKGAPGMRAPHVEGAWVRLPAASGRPAAGYLMVHGTGTADALVAASSPRAERIELHDMVMEDGVMRMRARSEFAVPAKGELAFVPGGAHLMLYGLSADVKAGDRVPVTLTFRSGARVETMAEARAPAAAAPGGGGHRH